MEQPPQNVTALDGKDAIITCRAVGAPTPNITWIYNGTNTAANCFFFINMFASPAFIPATP